jgi:hypothetical protein
VSESTNIELTTLLPADLLQQLEAEATRQQTPLAEVVRAAIQLYLQDVIDETPDEAIEAGFLQGWHEVMTGQTRPARIVLDELRKAQRDDRSD